MKKRGIALLLAVLLCSAWFVPVPAWAAEEEKLVLETSVVEGVTTRYYYNEEGKCVRTEDSNPGNVTEYVYHASGILKTKTVTRDGKTVEKMQYDSKGNLLLRQMWDSYGNLITTQCYINRYDTHGRLASSNWTEYFPSGVIRRENVVYTYYDEADPLSPLYLWERNGEFIESGEVKQSYTLLDFYSMEGLTVGVQGADGESSFTNTYRYDAAGNVEETMESSFKGESGEEISTTYLNLYNVSGQLIRSECQRTIRHFTGAADPAETVESWVEAYKYDWRGNKTHQTTRWSNGELISEKTWEYDKKGNLVKYTADGTVMEEYVYAPLQAALWK